MLVPVYIRVMSWAHPGHLGESTAPLSDKNSITMNRGPQFWFGLDILGRSRLEKLGCTQSCDCSSANRLLHGGQRIMELATQDTGSWLLEACGECRQGRGSVSHVLPHLKRLQGTHLG